MRNKDTCIVSARDATKNTGVRKFVTVVLLGENHGYRMKSYGATPLLKIRDNKTLLELQIDAIKSVFTDYEVILCCGFDTKRINDFVRDKLKNENVRIVENQVHYNSNCCESIRLALNNTMNNRVFISSGEIFLTPSYLHKFDYNKVSVAIQQQNINGDFEISAILNNKTLNTMCLGEKNNFWTEAIFLNNEESIRRLQNIVSNVDFKNKFMFEAINMLSKNTKIKVVENNSQPIVKINNIKTLRNIRKFNESTNSKLF